MGFEVNISIKLGFLLNCVGLSPEGLAGFTWGGYTTYLVALYGVLNTLNYLISGIKSQ